MQRPALFVERVARGNELFDSTRCLLRQLLDGLSQSLLSAMKIDRGRIKLIELLSHLRQSIELISNAVHL
ncbi:hypothetical protein B5D80_16520 [Micromonospora wenchangensis]|uniref:Uncharacterized protein n=1 Tax=Micromonospora wenchangensis TaxID=1185415 RepID=A0A246RMH7_9ACTN|nr:hypothetical protein B5D80_16520 [Micromonospora wenchangensis]